MKRVPQASRSRARKQTKPKKTRYKVRNWSEYNESLVQRGSLTLWISEEAIATWKPVALARRGGQFRYSDCAIQCLLLVRSVFHLTLRATEGFARSIFRLMRLGLAAPDYTTLCKRAAGWR